LVSGIISAKKIERRILAAGVSVTVSLGVTTFLFFLFSAMWRIPDPYWFVCITVPPGLLASMHVSLAKAEAADYANFRWPPFGAWEWIISTLGGLLFVLGCVGIFTDLKTRTEIWFMVSNMAVIVALFVTFGVLSRKSMRSESELT